MIYKGSCHCGAIAFEADGQLDRLMACNCSICSKRGSLLWFVGRDRFRLLSPEGNAGTYLFNKRVIKHRYCPTCGCAPFGEASDAAGRPMVAVNARCLDGVDLSPLQVDPFDGRSL